MLGIYKKSNIQRNNYYIIYFGTKKEKINKPFYIEMINVLFFI